MHETELIRPASTHHIFPSTAVTQSMVLGSCRGAYYFPRLLGSNRYVLSLVLSRSCMRLRIIFLAMYRGVKNAEVNSRHVMARKA